MAGRPKLWNDVMQARFTGGTFDAIGRLVGPGEDRTDFVRTAVENEIARRAAKWKGVSDDILSGYDPGSTDRRRIESMIQAGVPAYAPPEDAPVEQRIAETMAVLNGLIQHLVSERKGR